MNRDETKLEIKLPNLKPCPFCGGRATWFVHKSEAYVSCENECVCFHCEIQCERQRIRKAWWLFDMFGYAEALEKSIDAAAELWNRRA